jgi:hypothetical protein
MNLTVLKTAAALLPLAAAALAAALTIQTRYDATSDELTITVRKLRPMASAFATARSAVR